MTNIWNFPIVVDGFGSFKNIKNVENKDKKILKVCKSWKPSLHTHKIILKTTKNSGTIKIVICWIVIFENWKIQK